MKPLVALAVAGILLSTAYQAHAQVVGQRVRVKERSGAKIVGIVLDKSQDALTIASKDDATHQVPYAEMQSLDASIGRRTYRKAGALVGGGTGVLLGIVGGVLVAGSCAPNDYCAVISGIIGSVVYGIPGALAGLVVGSFITGDRWDAVPIPGRAASLVEPLVGVRATGQPVVGVRLTL